MQHPGYFNAIIFIKVEPGTLDALQNNITETGFIAKKYRNISPQGLDRFLRFASKFPGIQYINLYEIITRKETRYKERIYFT